MTNELHKNIFDEIGELFSEGDEVPPWARAILRKQNLTLKTLGVIMSALTDLQAAQAAEDTEIGQVIVFLNGLPAAIAADLAANGIDPAAVAAVTADLTAQTQNMSAALTTAQAALPPAAPAKPAGT